MDLLSEFKTNWQRKGFAGTDKPVLLAVSGGMDSMVMADLFRRSGIACGIAHCNFRLRDKDADLDEQHVKEWAERNHILFFTAGFDTNEAAGRWKKGIQETARILRYEWLDATRKANGYSYIATAHHANDNAETLLMNLFRGTGIGGLHGIPERNGQIIRPLLFATRAEIAAYAAERQLAYREDVSNASDKYTRNAIRLNILPAVEQHFPNAVRQLSESIQRFTQAEMLYRKEVDRTLAKLAEKRGNDIYIPVLKLKKMIALETICYELFSTYGFSPAQIPLIIQLADAGSGHFMESASHKLTKDRDFLIITALQPEQSDFIPVDAAPAVIRAGHIHFHFSFQKKTETIPPSPQTAFIDAARLSFPLILRRWRTGDYFYPLGMGLKKKKLSRFFIDQKIPVHQKEATWVLECNKRIVWVAGLRLDERFKITPNTQKILKVELRSL